MANEPTTAEQVRVFLAARRIRHHGWTRFQTGTRRAALRQVRRMTEQDTDDAALISRCPYCYSTDGHHAQCPHF